MVKIQPTGIRFGAKAKIDPPKYPATDKQLMIMFLEGATRAHNGRLIPSVIEGPTGTFSGGEKKDTPPALYKIGGKDNQGRDTVTEYLKLLSAFKPWNVSLEKALEANKERYNQELHVFLEAQPDVPLAELISEKTKDTLWDIINNLGKK